MDMSRGRMNPDDELLLQENFIYLKDNLEPDHVIDHLLQKNVITFDQHKEVRHEKSCQDKTEKLLHILRFAGKNSFHHFIDALRKSKYISVAEKLSEGCKTVCGSNECEIHVCTSENVFRDNLKQKQAKEPTENIESLNFSEADCSWHTDSMNMKDISTDSGTKKRQTSTIVNKCSVSKSCQVSPEEFSNEPGYEVMSSDETYDTPMFSNSTELCLNTPYNDTKLPMVSGIYDFEEIEAMHSVPGWCPRIKDSNHSDVEDSLKSGDFFIWFSKQKDAYIITLGTDLRREGVIHVKVKTRTVGNDVLFRIVKDKEFNSLEELFQYYINAGLPTKLIKK